MALRVLSRAVGRRACIPSTSWLSPGAAADVSSNSCLLNLRSPAPCAAEPKLPPFFLTGQDRGYHFLNHQLDHGSHPPIGTSQTTSSFLQPTSKLCLYPEPFSASTNFPTVRSVMSHALSDKQIDRAADIGYRIQGTLDASEAPVKIQLEPRFAVVQVGSHQFKVTAGDAIYVEKLLSADVNDKVALEKVLLLGSRETTVIGRPYIPSAMVSALVEEHFLDAKVIIFKKKRRKNHRRTNGHRQELTRLRILGVHGLEEHPGSEAQQEEEETFVETQAVAAA